MKSLAGEGLAEAMGDLLGERLATCELERGPDLVIPVPLHWRRRLQRGYNQSEALADRVAVRLRLRMQASLLRRVRSTPHQSGQTSPTARRENLRGAFQAIRRAGLVGKTVLLVDDVLTTGATASEAARALREAGAASVIVGVLARAV